LTPSHRPLNGISLPFKAIIDQEMSALWDHTTRQVCAANDLYSAKKEVDQGIMAFVILLYAQTGSLQGAVDAVVEDIRRAGEDLEAAAARLRQKYAAEPEVVAELDKFIITCQCFCTSNNTWSLYSERYGMGKMKWIDGAGLELQM